MLFSLLFWVKVSEIRLSAKDYNVIIFQSVSLLVPLHAGIWFSRLFQSYWPLNELYTTNPIHPFTHIHTALYSVLLMLSKALFSLSHGHTCGQFRITYPPNTLIFELWEERTHAPRRNAAGKFVPTMRTTALLPFLYTYCLVTVAGLRMPLKASWYG